MKCQSIRVLEFRHDSATNRAIRSLLSQLIASNHRLARQDLRRRAQGHPKRRPRDHRSEWEVRCGISAAPSSVANAHKGKVKLTFAYGAKIPDPDKLFNAGLEGNARRAIDFLEGDKVNAPALKNLVRAAIAYNQSKAKKKAPTKAKAAKPSVLARKDKLR
jgi:hypothetical protein